MSTTTADLWPPDLATPSGRKAPATILREAGAQLGQRTKNLVLGRVVPEPKPSEGGPVPMGERAGPRFRYAFLLVAPALDFYEFKLFTIEHGMNLYPVHLRPEGGRAARRIAHKEADFMNLLKRVFESDDTRRVINSLLEQSQSVEV